MTQIDRRAFIAAAGASAAIPFAARARTPSEGWIGRTPLPWVVQEIYCAVSAGRIVTAGGLRRPARVMEIEDRTGVYDPAADVWSEGPRLPQPRHHPMLIAAADGTVFAFGGYGSSESGDWTGMIEVWAMEADGWREAGRMPGPLSETIGVELGGRLHLVTGRSPGTANGQWNDQVDVDTHLVFLPGEERWETARPCPMARNSAAGAVLGGALWVAGGRTVSGGGTGRLDRYDPAADRWDTLAPIPASPVTGQQVGGGLAMAAVAGKLVAFGGEWFAPGGGGGVFAETWIYDPAADRWEAGTPMRTPRHGLAGAAVAGVVYAIAGGELVSGGRPGGVVEALRL